MNRSALPILFLLLVLVPAIGVAVYLAQDDEAAPESGEVGPAPVRGPAAPENEARPGERAGTSGPEEEAVLDRVQELFDAIGMQDSASLRRVMLPDARLTSLSEEGGEVETTIRSRDEFVASLLGVEAHFLERMWDAEVRIDGALAMVWTPYDFHVDQEFSHCGVDLMTLIRGDEGWRVTAVTWTRHPPGRCDESPLGPPAG